MFDKKLVLPLLFSALLLGCGGGGAGSPGMATASGASSGIPDASTSAKPIVAPASACLSRRLVVGYQGWYGCPGDFAGNTDWQHWFRGAPLVENILVDMLPEIDDLPADALCETGLHRRNGSPLRLFSSQNPRVVDYHFQLMAKHGIGGVALQRFVNQLDDPGRKSRVDNVLRNVMRAAEANGVPFFISYDVTGADPATALQQIRDDWRYLVREVGVSASSAYLQDSGKPVLQLWGFGFVGNPGAPAEVRTLLSDLKAGAGQLPTATVLGGVPSGWRTQNQDSKTDPAWRDVYLGFDILSPWMVGRFADADGAHRYFADVIAADLSLVRAQGVRYLPVIFPGFSWYNLMRVRGEADRATINQIPRQCGNFIWSQSHVLLSNGVDSVYGAMFDELDESTAMLPAQPLLDQFPAGMDGVYLDRDGCSLSPTWYVEVLGKIAQNFRTMTVPSLPLMAQ